MAWVLPIGILLAVCRFWASCITASLVLGLVTDQLQPGLQSAVLQVVEADVSIVPRHSKTGSLTCSNNQQTSRVTPDTTHHCEHHHSEHHSEHHGEHHGEHHTTNNNHTDQILTTVQIETINNDVAKRTVRLMGNFIAIPYVVIIWARGGHGQAGLLNSRKAKRGNLLWWGGVQWWCGSIISKNRAGEDQQIMLKVERLDWSNSTVILPGVLLFYLVWLTSSSEELSEDIACMRMRVRERVMVRERLDHSVDTN